MQCVQVRVYIIIQFINFISYSSKLIDLNNVSGLILYPAVSIYKFRSLQITEFSEM